MIYKDLNLFDVYKNSSSNQNGLRNIIIIGVTFIAVVILSFGTFLFLKINTQGKINVINKALSDPTVMETQVKLTQEVEKNTHLNNYRTGIKKALDSFNKSRTLNSLLFSRITSPEIMPGDVNIKSFTVTAVSITLVCESVNNISAANFTSNLNNSNYFRSASYNAVTLNSNGTYDFNIICTYKGEQ